MTTGSRVLGVLGVLASLLGMQTLAGSTPLPRPVVMLLPSEQRLAGVGDGLRRGYRLAQEQSEVCGGLPPELGLGWVPPASNPLRALEAGPPLSLLIAPPAAPLAAYGQLAERLEATVLLPLQRGLSLRQLASLRGSERLWPLTPARSEAADQLARAAVSRGWKRVMVIRDGSAEAGQWAERFVGTLQLAGGSSIGAAEEPIRVDPAQTKDWAQLLDDVSWYRPQALMVITRPGSPLARAAAAAQWPEALALVWPFATWRDLARPQLGIGTTSQGPGWGPFEQAFRRRWGYPPGLVEAAGYDAGQLTVVAAVPVQATGRLGWDLRWLNARLSATDLCSSLALRRAGQQLALKGAASKLDLVPAGSPNAELQLSDRPTRP
ncbi:ABC transporter substrate-binding protein [Cyanobium sp. Morenito 9A2]|uniref:ABC transporter substrate-binding protein n=1 Tax=Cyanobium sp. Morenito 9A2 TaxID=2823718 RepID=UPI0020CFABE0|nr:histidine kinase [Cyanobium sp. Morenito 9A2]MCP9849312.1 histidine kinase [Cyanobium sp. Morenito 9A2]